MQVTTRTATVHHHFIDIDGVEYGTTFQADEYIEPKVAVDRVRCDQHSEFDADGFALPLDGERRAWTPHFGAPCEVCGVAA